MTGLLIINYTFFVDNKLIVYLSQDKPKSILFVTTHKLQNAKTYGIVYSGTEIKQYTKVKYSGFISDQSLSGESMTLNVIDKVNLCLRFLHRQKHPLCVGFYVMH